MAINMNGVSGADIAGKGKALASSGSFLNKWQDVSHFTGNSTINGSRWKAGATHVAAGAATGMAVGGLVGGVGGAISDDSTFFGGALKGAAIGGGISGTASLGMLGYGRHLGKSPYTYKTSVYTHAGVAPGTTFKENATIDLKF